jgi:hypothetical protein
MVVARMGVWGKGQQSLAPPQHAVTPEREQRFGSNDPLSPFQKDFFVELPGPVFRSSFDGLQPTSGSSEKPKL